MLEARKKKLEKTAGKVKAYSGADVMESNRKAMFYGGQGTGKTFTALGPLLADLKVLGISTDIGGNGFVTLGNELKRLGRLDLFHENFRGLDLVKYEQVAAFLEADVGIQEILETGWTPDVLLWDGFSTFQVDMTDEYVLKMESRETDSQLRGAGLVAGKQDWAAIKRATLRPLRKFLAKSYGETTHKILTCVEKVTEDQDSGRVISIGPLVQGSSRDLAGLGFDVIIQTFKTVKMKDKNNPKQGRETKFFYRTADDSDRRVTKSRGFDLEAIMDADPLELWRALVPTQTDTKTEENTNE
jgi:hypothetical protein